MAQLKMLWVNVGEGGPNGVSRVPFERFFDLAYVAPAELEDPGLERAWDAMCFDFDYPDLSGLSLIPAAKARWPSAPILMLTLQSSSELAVWALRSRVFDLLVKPAVVNEVEHMLERVVAALRSRRSQAGRKPQTIAAQPPIETRYHPLPRAGPRLQAALAHVAKNFPRPIPESEVALLCNMSPSRFCREFKAAFAVTFVEYLATYRVAQAKRLLANPNMAVADVAVAVGFNDPSYFTRVFRKQESVSPSAYREDVRGKSAKADTSRGKVPAPEVA
jgi:AraC-like DNA-binding protein